MRLVFTRSKDMAELWPWQTEAQWIKTGIILCTWKRQWGASDARTLEGDKGGTSIPSFLDRRCLCQWGNFFYAKHIELPCPVQNFSFQQACRKRNQVLNLFQQTSDLHLTLICSLLLTIFQCHITSCSCSFSLTPKTVAEWERRI